MMPPGFAAQTHDFESRYLDGLIGQRERACVSFASGNIFVAGWPDDDSQP